MSTFWDAIGRAALGLPGTAEPRPRWMFEPDGPMGLIEDVEPPLEDAAATDLTPVAIIFPVAPAVPSPSATPDDPARQAQSVGRPDDDDEEDLPRSIEPASLTAGANPARLAVAAPVERAELPQPPPFAAEHIEPRHVETTRVLSEFIRQTAPREMPTPVVSAPAADVDDDAEPPAAIQPATPEDDETEAAQPVSLVAEPRAVAVEPPPLSPTTQELQPLIVEIERIEIRIEPERVAAPPSARRAEPMAIPSLSDYLARLDGSRP